MCCGRARPWAAPVGGHRLPRCGKEHVRQPCSSGRECAEAMAGGHGLRLCGGGGAARRSRATFGACWLCATALDAGARPRAAAVRGHGTWPWAAAVRGHGRHLWVATG